MSFLSSDATLEIPYSTADCFSAMKSAAETLPKFKIKSENVSAGRLQYSVRAGMTSFTWGDIVTVGFTPTPDGGTKVSMTSTAKAPSLLASVTENKNIEALTNAFMDKIQSYQKVSSTTPVAASASAADEIRKYKELLDMGAITQDEFDQKKTQLLGL